MSWCLLQEETGQARSGGVPESIAAELIDLQQQGAVMVARFAVSQDDR